MTGNRQFDLEVDGFCILKNVFEEWELSQVRYRAEEVIENCAQKPHGTFDGFEKYFLPHRTDQGVLYDLYQRIPEFRRLAESPTILNALKPIIGDNVLLYENSLVYKPKSKRNEVPWHQDFMDRPNEPLKLIAWIALDKVTVENGALKVIPGSHNQGFLPWIRKEGETHHTRLDTDGLNLDDFVFAELEPGDVLIFNQKLVHGSDRVSSPENRRAYRISYQNFEQIYSPRATPIVLSLGNPRSVFKPKPVEQETNNVRSVSFKTQVKERLKIIVKRVLGIK